MLSESAQTIAGVPQFVEDDKLNDGLREYIEDPGLRDTAIYAAWQLSPTAQSGIHTVEVSSRRGDYGSLSLRERLVLKEAVDRPDMKKTKRGSFKGKLRAADLDKHRVVLRDVHDIGSIRCIINPNLETQTKSLFASCVTAEGEYETDKNGRPRLLRIDRLTEAEDQQVIDI